MRAAEFGSDIAFFAGDRPVSHDGVVLRDELRPQSWAAEGVQTGHSQMLASRDLERRELTEAGGQRNWHPRLDPRALLGVLGGIDAAVGVHARD